MRMRGLNSSRACALFSACFQAAATAFLSFAVPLSLHAETGSAIVTGGGEVKFENAETNWVKNAEGGLDLILRFTEGGSYTLPGVSQVRLLAVGGGGGGGGS